jgi:glutathione synthase/RimK-type ligase-like ATP-grasp enzyme
MADHPRNIPDKWKKHEVLRKHARLSRYMPETRRLTRSSLDAMLRKYGMVYVKPVIGSLGAGVMRVERRGSGLQYQAGLRIRRFARLRPGYAAIVRETRRKPYMVQQGIRLARYRGRPFDIRVMVQRTPKRSWTVTGMAGRVAHPRKVVTNGSQGGTIYPVSVLLPHSARLRHIGRIGIRAARRMRAVFPGVVEIGLDVAIDRAGKPWILEANTRPDPCPFTKLPSRGALRRIVRYQAAWGIRRSLRCVKAKRGI